MKDLEVILNPNNIDLEPVIGLDLETSGLKAWEEEVKLIIISTSRNIYILDTSHYQQTFLREVMQNLTFCEAVIAHNAKFDCGFIYQHYGVLLRNLWCTQIASQILTNGKNEFMGKHSLPEVIERYLGDKLEFTAKNKKLLQKSFTSQFALDRFTDKQLRYASDDVKYLIPLYTRLNKLVDNLGLRAICKLENQLIPVLAKMEIEGILIDADNWRKLIKSHWEPDLYELERRLDEEVRKLKPSYGHRREVSFTQFDLFGGGSTVVWKDRGLLNYGSSEQLIGLFKELGEEVPSVELKEKEKNEEDDLSTEQHSMGLFDDNTDTSIDYNTDGGGTVKESLEEGVLTTYMNERPTSRMKPFIKLLLEYRVAAKRVSTYGEKFLVQLDKNSKIHTGYTQTFTATGRLSSKAPNLQNIPAPAKGKDWTNIRRFFVARPGYSLITCDMSGAEISIAADYSQEPLLLDSLTKGVDLHSELASISFSIIFGQEFKVSKSEEPINIKGQEFIPVELRTHHKSVVFAKFYKAGAKRVYSVLAEYINLFHSEDKRLEIASKVSEALDKRMPVLSKYLDSLIKKANKEGNLRGSRLGRIRYFKENAYGECANFPIQNTNAEALKMAMIDLFELFETNKHWDGRIALNVHDECACEVLDQYAKEAAIAVKRIMSDSLSYFLKTIKGGASTSIGKFWEK